MGMIGGQFFWLLGTGMAVFFPFLSVRHIGKTFHQWNHVFVAVSLGLGFWLLKLPPYWGFIVMAFLFNSAFFVGPPALRKVGSVFEVFFLLLLVMGFAFEMLGSPTMVQLNQITTALLLGATAMALIVGHWYLVAPGISFGFLKKYTWAVVVTLILRALFLSVLTWESSHVLGGEMVTYLTDVFYLMRMLFGIVMPLVFAFMALNALKYKNNQAATGILYVALIMVIMGELVHYVILAPQSAVY